MPQNWPLTLTPQTLCFIVAKARQFDAKDVVTEPDPASNASDDGMASVLESHRDDAVYAELTSHIEDMNVDEQIDLVALTWLGRGDDDVAGWRRIRDEARRAHNDRTATYLLGMPLLADYLEEGMSQFGQSCAELEAGL